MQYQVQLLPPLSVIPPQQLLVLSRWQINRPFESVIRKDLGPQQSKHWPVPQLQQFKYWYFLVEQGVELSWLGLQFLDHPQGKTGQLKTGLRGTPRFDLILPFQTSQGTGLVCVQSDRLTIAINIIQRHILFNEDISQLIFQQTVISTFNIPSYNRLGGQTYFQFIY